MLRAKTCFSLLTIFSVSHRSLFVCLFLFLCTHNLMLLICWCNSWRMGCATCSSLHAGVVKSLRSASGIRHRPSLRGQRLRGRLCASWPGHWRDETNHAACCHRFRGESELEPRSSMQHANRVAPGYRRGRWSFATCLLEIRSACVAALKHAALQG